MTGTALKNACIHSPFPSSPLLPSLRIKARAQSRAMLGFWVLKNHSMKTEDDGERGREKFPNSTEWTSQRSLFWMLDGNDKPVPQVFFTITDIV